MLAVETEKEVKTVKIEKSKELVEKKDVIIDEGKQDVKELPSKKLDYKDKIDKRKKKRLEKRLKKKRKHGLKNRKVNF